MDKPIELIPVAMSYPNEEGIYSLSQYREVKRITREELEAYICTRGKLEVDGVVGEVDFYGKGLDCWYVAREARPALLLEQ